jgi:N-acetylglucosamine-6-sulfatase
VLLDDLRWDELGCAGHPYVKTPHTDRIAREGALFRNAFATTPLCSPSRASFLTGQYVHKHTVRDNVDRSPLSHQLVTFPLRLQRAGYETAYVGKWHMGVDASPRPGFDYWLSVKGQGRYLNPELNENGRSLKASGYVTDIFNERAVAFLARPRTKPFCLYIAHKAVHPDLVQNADGTISDPLATNFLPAERYKTLYAGVTIPRRPNAHDSLAGKPALQRAIPGLPPLSAATWTTDQEILNRQRMFASVDEGIGRLFETLEKAGQLDNTVIVFTSDHGYFYGEHGLSVERRLAYEETIRIPLLIRYPPLIKPGTVVDSIVLNIDIAPTMLDLAHVPIPAEIQGRSPVPLLKGESVEWRKSFLIEYFSETDKVFRRVKDLGYEAVREERWKYIHYRHLRGADELYDLKTDPYELKNRIDDADARPALTSMQKELERLRIESR